MDVVIVASPQERRNSMTSNTEATETAEAPAQGQKSAKAARVG